MLLLHVDDVLKNDYVRPRFGNQTTPSIKPPPPLPGLLLNWKDVLPKNAVSKLNCTTHNLFLTVFLSIKAGTLSCYEARQFVFTDKCTRLVLKEKTGSRQS